MKFRFELLCVSFVASFLSNVNSAQAQSSWSTFAQEHPRRAQVLSSDNALKNELNQDYGKLGGNYAQLQSMDNSIRAQEQQDARQNGGYITRAQWAQLDSEEAALQNSINNDYNGNGQQGGTPINPWQDYSPGNNAPPPPAQLPPSGLLSILGGYTGQACGWAGSSGFSTAGSGSQLIPALPPTSTSSIDLNTAF